jgi:hypothetical protein
MVLVRYKKEVCCESPFQLNFGDQTTLIIRSLFSKLLINFVCDYLYEISDIC